MQYDKDFLLKLDKSKNKTIYAKIIKLTFNEDPIEMIEGQVTGGSINIDGASALRRTCSLSLINNNSQYSDFYCALNSKFKLEIGVENNVDSSYPEIIWFNQGVYVVTSFSTSRSTNNCSISLSGKDKMCLLNGDVGGTLESTVDFGQIEEEDIFGVWTTRHLPIKDIIRNAVHVYGKEPFHNIIIKDLEDYGAELLEYRYDVPLYLYRSPNSNTYINALFSDCGKTYYYSTKVENINGNKDITWSSQSFVLDEIEDEYFENLNSLVNSEEVYLSEDKSQYFCFTKIKYGEACGYRTTDLTYPGDLISKPGESLTSMLDKIRTILVEFEYFYNVDGQFIFQKKPSTLSVMQNLNPEKGNEIVSNLFVSDNIYTFHNGETLISLNNNPNLLNLKNDYSIWGERTTASGANIPIHLRYVIDKKPIRYTSISISGSEDQVKNYADKNNIIVSGQTSQTYIADTYWHTEGNIQYCDWREVLYRMAADYYRYNFLDDFNYRVSEKNGNLYPLGITGYEGYYTDIYSFWRDLYNPLQETLDKLEDFLIEATKQKESLEDEIKEETMGTKEYNILQSKIDYLIEKQTQTEAKITNLKFEQENYYNEEYGDDELDKMKKRCWNKYVFTQSYSLNFWFDFLDTNGALSQYNVQSIGSRQKVVNEKLKAISYNKVPNIIYRNSSRGEDVTMNQKSGYRYIQINNSYSNMFSISGQGISLQEKLNELINIHSFCSETVSITAIPIYYLEPNSRIIVTDSETGLNNVYIINKISIPLTYNGTMSLNGNKVYDNII